MMLLFQPRRQQLHNCSQITSTCSLLDCFTCLTALLLGSWAHVELTQCVRTKYYQDIYWFSVITGGALHITHLPYVLLRMTGSCYWPRAARKSPDICCSWSPSPAFDQTSDQFYNLMWTTHRAGRKREAFFYSSRIVIVPYIVFWIWHLRWMSGHVTSSKNVDVCSQRLWMFSSLCEPIRTETFDLYLDEIKDLMGTKGEMANKGPWQGLFLKGQYTQKQTLIYLQWCPTTQILLVLLYL